MSNEVLGEIIFPFSKFNRAGELICYFISHIRMDVITYLSIRPSIVHNIMIILL